MVVPDRIRARWARVAVPGLVVVAFGMLVTHDLLLGRRVTRLEAAVAARDAADPLMPFECLHPRERAPSGQSRDKPCIVTFQRLLEAPQQFQGRWVEVQGTYWHGPEQSELFPLDWTPPAPGHWPQPGHALAVSVAPLAPLDAQDHGVFIGRFQRGPTGPDANYAGLSNQ
jgi:hypothetical protein